MRNFFKLKTSVVILTSVFVSIFNGSAYAEDELKASSAVFYLKDLNGKNGFTIDGRADGWSGYSVSVAGDVNGDGIDDILIGAYHANNDKGQSYVLFGSKESWPAVIDCENLNGTNGFIINGINPIDYSGYSVSGDNITDILIYAPIDAYNSTDISNSMLSLKTKAKI